MDEQSVEVRGVAAEFRLGSFSNVPVFFVFFSFVGAEHRRSVPLLHLHGEAEGRSPVPALLQALLLQLHTSTRTRFYYGAVFDLEK